ncbi:DUF2637 domain-containing protein [Nocardia noduli]|uniref:DUF2637 domain-containing protein n=1 Tax=Nocardia noduli TaxID=2815722 RepID=UPI001C214496|nr:DUF2637 domain-containing protein [Nocardia noduli]
MSAADQHKSTAMKWARWSAAVIILAVGAAAFRLSFTTLQDLAVLARVPKSDAWLFPLIVDGTILLATFGVLVSPSKTSEQRFFLAVLGIGAAVSVAGNSIHAMASGHPLPGWAAAIVAAVAPISLLADTHGLALLFRTVQRAPTPVTESTAVVASAGEVAVDPVSADPEPVASATPEPVSVASKPVAKKPARTDPRTVARAVELHRDGMKYADIARELGVSARTAAKYAKSTDTPESVDYETVPAEVLDSPTPAPEPERAPVRVAAAAVPVRVAPVRPVRPVQTMLPVAAVPAGGF